MTGYSFALFFHLVFVLVATAAAALTTFAALRLRRVTSAAEAAPWLALNGTVVPAFPVAVLGLLATGIYMTHARWTWSTPWIDAALFGLGLIVVLGSGIERSRGNALRRALASSEMSMRAQRLLRDPVSWTAKMTTLTLVVAIVFVMTVKPMAGKCVAAFVLAAVAGVLGAVPIWYAPRATETERTNPASP